jgi:hypothetical protein
LNREVPRRIGVVRIFSNSLPCTGFRLAFCRRSGEWQVSWPPRSKAGGPRISMQPDYGHSSSTTSAGHPGYSLFGRLKGLAELGVEFALRWLLP